MDAIDVTQTSSHEPTSVGPTCSCGTSHQVAFSDEYDRCPECGTLHTRRRTRTDTVTPAVRAATQSDLDPSRIGVDLTPLLPGSDNGGAKIMTMELLRNLKGECPDLELVLLTSNMNHEELSSLDGPGVSRICILDHLQKADGVSTANWRQMAHRLADRLPAPILEKLIRLYWSIRRLPQADGSLIPKVDVLFCPFSAPFYHTAHIPTVSVIYDLQFLDYPQFFTSEERHSRTSTFQTACRAASHLVCISDFTRQAVLEHSDVPAERVSTIRIQTAGRLDAIDRDATKSALERLGLESKRYLLYPANFWPHKNHSMLLTAFAIYRARHPDSGLRLVCTGAPGPQMDRIERAAATMGLADATHFPGFLDEAEFAAVVESAAALIFPSLYEGFGMPLLEAMACGVPVLCSNRTALPEVANNAALLFDPRRPDEIADAIEQIERDPETVSQLRQRGFERLADFSDARSMARQYYAIFEATTYTPGRSTLTGVHSDGWTGSRLAIKSDVENGELELELALPAHYPFERAAVHIRKGGPGSEAESHSIERDQSIVIRRRLRNGRSHTVVHIEPCFRPIDLAINEDRRELGCLCNRARIVSPDRVIDLLAQT